MNTSRLRDAEIAVEKHGWAWVTVDENREFLCPPIDSELFYFTGIYDIHGIPQYLPEYSKEENDTK